MTQEKKEDQEKAVIVDRTIAANDDVELPVVVDQPIHADLQDDTSTIQTLDPLLVRWDGEDDQEDVRLMSKTRKWVIVILMTCTTLQLTMLNSAWSTLNDTIRIDMGCSQEVALLGLSAFVLALAVGPLLIAPMSEYYGRRPMYIIGFAGYIIFQFPTAFGKNIASLVVGRFFAAFFGSVLLSNSPGTVSDILYKHELHVPMSMCGFAAIGGPGFGPAIAGFMEITVGWRWVFYLFIIWSVVMFALVMIIVPETYEPILKSKKAVRLREKTGKSYYSEHEKQRTTPWNALVKNCQRPIMLLVKEPMLQVLCFYTGFFMAIIYLFLTAFPMVFKTVYGFEIQFVGLTFMGNAFGMGLSVVTSPIFERRRLARIEKNGGISKPELRMPQACVGGIVVPIALFIFAWTVYPQVHWIVPILASLLFGLGCNWTFSAILSYIVEAYPLYAASATAANVFVRCLMSTAFPLFGQQMMRGMGYHWAMSMIAFIAVAMAPCGFLFGKYGHILRAKSKFARN